ncbi:MAG: response regulator [Candidatus Spechtbacterales bacterium]
MSQKILLIEDDPFLSEIYVAKFKEAGFEMSHAADGSRGLQKIKDEHPDLLILDIVMPNIDGFEILRAIKDERETKDIPVVILSNLGEQEDVEKGLQLGAAAYIIKAHHTPTEIVAKVKAILINK